MPVEVTLLFIEHNTQNRRLVACVLPLLGHVLPGTMGLSQNSVSDATLGLFISSVFVGA